MNAATTSTRLVRAGLVVGAALLAGCITDAQLPSPAIGVDAARLGCASRYPLLDEQGGAGTVSFGSEGLTKSTTEYGAGARFHLAFTFQNRGTAAVKFIPAAVRLRDAL